MSGSWHEENCDCKKCTFYKNHDELCGCAPCYYRERYNHYKTQNSDCTKLQSENDKLKIERENLLKGKWEILGSGDFNKNNKTVYEHDILMDQQDKYFQGRLKTLEADHVSQQIELNSKLASMSEQLEKQESVLENKLINHFNAEIKTSFGMTLTELFATVGEQNKIMIELETRNGEQLMSALEKIQDEANSKIRKQKGFVIEQQLVIDEKSCENDNLMKEMKKIVVEFDCLRKTHFELEKRVEVLVREKSSFSGARGRSAPESEFSNEIPEKEQYFYAHKMSSDFTQSPEKYEMDCGNTIADDTIDDDSDDSLPETNDIALLDPDFDKIATIKIAPMKVEKDLGTVDLTVDTMDFTIDTEIL